MTRDEDLSVLLSKAQQGDRKSLDTLTTCVRREVNLYLYRVTLDYHLAQDLTQDTLLILMKSLKRLEPGNNASLWAWIYRTALGQLQHHQRMQGQRRVDHDTVVDHDKLAQMVDRSQDAVIIRVQRREMMEAITQSLNTLKLAYRSVLTLRCFEQLSYAEIATVTGGTEMQARLTFFRAKQALKRQLSRRGIKKDSMLSALTLFGLASALRIKHASAATAVTSSLVTTSAATTIIGMVISPLGVLGAALLVIGLATGTSLLHSRGTPEGAGPVRIIAAQDPDGDGWQRMIPHDDGSIIWEATDFKTIIQEKWFYFCLAIPQDHWLEFGFKKPLTDGPGFDITYHCLQSGGFGKIYLTDGLGQLYPLTNPTIRKRMKWDYNIYFDLADADPPFEPVAVRVEGGGPPGSKQVFVLTNLRTRN